MWQGGRGGVVCILFKKREVTSGLTGRSRGFPSFCTNENTLCQISTLSLSRKNVVISLAFYTKHSSFKLLSEYKLDYLTSFHTLVNLIKDYL